MLRLAWQITDFCGCREMLAWTMPLFYIPKFVSAGLKTDGMYAVRRNGFHKFKRNILKMANCWEKTHLVSSLLYRPYRWYVHTNKWVCQALRVEGVKRPNSYNCRKIEVGSGSWKAPCPNPCSTLGCFQSCSNAGDLPVAAEQAAACSWARYLPKCARNLREATWGARGHSQTWQPSHHFPVWFTRSHCMAMLPGKLEPLPWK